MGCKFRVLGLLTEESECGGGLVREVEMRKYVFGCLIFEYVSRCIWGYVELVYVGFYDGKVVFVWVSGSLA